MASKPKVLILIHDSDEEDVQQEHIPLQDQAPLCMPANNQEQEQIPLQDQAPLGMPANNQEQEQIPLQDQPPLGMPAKNQEPQPNLIWRGPSYGGNDMFDHHCIFANDMGLKEEQCDYLNDIMGESPGVPIKYYVYRMTSSFARKSKAKMKFSTHFTQTFLRPYLRKPVMLNVECGGKEKEFAVKLKIEAGTNSAILSGGWVQAVKEWGIANGDIVFFCFFPDKHDVLHLLLVPL